MRTTILSLAGLASLASAKTCTNMTVPVTISARQGVFNNTMVPVTNLDVTTFVQNMTKQGSNYSATALSGYATVEGTYNISTMLCMPDSNYTSPSIQILTHGIGFDKTYWDLAYNDYNYSYIDNATGAGYYTLSFDRLGIANSSHGNPLNEIQTNLEVQALYSLTKMMRDGLYPDLAISFDKVLHVGHSYGSIQTYSLVSLYPDASDGIVLTGFTTNSSFMGYFLAGANFEQASLNAPKRFGNATNTTGAALPNGYIISSDIEANQYLFFKPGYFDEGLLEVAEDTKQPVTLGELLTIGAIPKMTNFTGPVFVINGDSDLPFCGGDCLNTGISNVTNLGESAKMAFPNASSFESYVQPNTGHGINAHYNATGAYEVILGFFSDSDLESS